VFEPINDQIDIEFRITAKPLENVRPFCFWQQALGGCGQSYDALKFLFVEMQDRAVNLT
jgi:hypothetical protein